MFRAANPNLAILETAVERLDSLVDELVFLGGCATGLLLTDPAAPPIRVTQDVDVITEVASIADYYRLADRLRKQGFQESQAEDAPLCRWVAASVVLDVMPTDPAIIGFGNVWYQPALNAATECRLPSGKFIRMVTGPYFLTTKLAAFSGRGDGDYVMSHDMEDIIAVLDGRPELASEVAATDEHLRDHLRAQFRGLLANDRFVESLSGHLPGDAGSQARLPLLIERLRTLAGLP